MKNIGIIEYHYHSIYFYSLARICKTKNTNVTLFTTKKIYSLIEPHLKNKENYEIILKDENETINSFLKKVEKICDDRIDILFINTIQESCKDLPHYFKFNPSCNMILTVHDANTWLKPGFKIDFKRPFATLDTLVSSFLISKIILKKFDAINVIYSPIRDYISQHTDYKKEVFTLPFTTYDEKKDVHLWKKDEKIKFIIPGAIIESRRDHSVVMETFERLFEKFPKEISLCLLGKPEGTYGKKIIENAEELKSKGYDVSYFDKFVEEKTYDKLFSESTIVIAPIKLNARSLGVIKETFGKTKSSGIFFDAIQYSKPLILPYGHKVVKEMQSSVLKYKDSEDLEQILTGFIEDKSKLEKLVKEALKNSKNFSLEKMQKYLESKILKNKSFY